MADVVRISTRGAGKIAAQFSRAGRELQRTVREEITLVGERAEGVLSRKAPFEEGDLAGNIEAFVLVRSGRIKVTLRSGARSETGFDYTRVTRFGHRAGRQYIYPKRRKALVLRNIIDPNTGDELVTPRVRAYHPRMDWVDAAMPQIERLLLGAEKRIARSIDTRILR